MKNLKMKKLLLSMAIFGLGTFAMAQQKQGMDRAQKAEKMESMEVRQAKQVEKMKTELNLTDAQVAKINALHAKGQAERNAKKQSSEAKKAMMMEKRAKADNEMKQILTPAQFTKWEQNKKKNMEMRKNKMGSRTDKMERKP